jgi:CRISPR/Cas system CSM-associated protein Csm2 small subunit
MGYFGRVSRGAEKKIHGMGKDSYSSEETDSSDDEYQQAKNLHLLHLKSLRIYEVGNENDMPKDNEWWETVQVGHGRLKCQLDTGAQASVMTAKKLQSIAPDARIKKTQKRLVSYSQHPIVPRGCTTLKVKHKEK